MKQKLYGIILLLLIVLITLNCNSGKQDSELRAGREVYIANCVTCHGENGQGIAGPSLVRPEGIILEAQTTRAIQLIKEGSGTESGMRPMALTNQEITEVVNYIQNSWGNKAPYTSLTQIESYPSQP